MLRRDFVTAGAAVAGSLVLPDWTRAADGESVPFSQPLVTERARQLAAKPFSWPTPVVPDGLSQLNYSQYQSIRFKPEGRVWRDSDLPYQLDLLHSGFIFNLPVQLFVVEDGQARKMTYDPAGFTFGDGVPAPEDDAQLEFAGFRARAELNQPERWDEFLVFAGASYFRATAKGQVYGLSARGLAINTADPAGEEFPFFREFYIERPDRGMLIIHALLDAPSTAGAYRFTVRPGDMTTMDVEATLFTRTEVKQLGMSPLTSMFLYNTRSSRSFDDFRPSVHDSQGLSIWNGRNEWLWRPLQNGVDLQISAFVDTGLRGFGLLQRDRSFSGYEDLEARYDLRPSVWVEPIGDWQKGAVVLVEIPTDAEIHDNVVCFWRPDQPLAGSSEASFTYRLYWCWEPPQRSSGPQIVRTLQGVGSKPGWRRFVVDYGNTPDSVADVANLEVNFTSSRGQIHNVVLQPNGEVGGYRISLELDPAGETLVECRVDLIREGEIYGESWIYRWTG